jgi:hypothetical protein
MLEINLFTTSDRETPKFSFWPGTSNKIYMEKMLDVLSRIFQAFKNLSLFDGQFL